MAYTPEGRKLTEQHRLAQVDLSNWVMAEIMKAFRELFTLDDIAGSAMKAALRVLPMVMAAREKSTELSREYMHEFHRVEAGGTEMLLEPDSDVVSEDEVLQQLARAAARAATEVMRKGHTPEDAHQAAVKTAGLSASKTVQGGGRRYIEASMKKNSGGAVGYIRVVDADPCAFCAMLASRVEPNDLYHSVYAFAETDARYTGSGKFKVHDGCCCTMEPVYRVDGKLKFPGNGDRLRYEWNRVAAGQKDPMNTWRRWRERGKLPPNIDYLDEDDPLQTGPQVGQAEGRRVIKPQLASEAEREALRQKEAEHQKRVAASRAKAQKVIRENREQKIKELAAEEARLDTAITQLTERIERLKEQREKAEALGPTLGEDLYIDADSAIMWAKKDLERLKRQQGRVTRDRVNLEKLQNA